MTFTKNQRWLLVSAAAFALPAALAVWWMVPHEQSASVPADDIGQEERGTVRLEEGTPPAATDTYGNAEDKKEEAAFHAYAAALKQQGLPETTVRELIASRVTAAFQGRRTAIRNSARQGHASSSDIQLQLDALNQKQGALIERLVGAEQHTETVAATATTAAATTPKGIERPPLMPAAMAEEMPASVKTEEQAAEWDQLRTDFVNAVGGASHSTASPEYRQRWMRAESEADRRFRLLYGDTAYVQHQLQAQREAALREQAPSGK